MAKTEFSLFEPMISRNKAAIYYIVKLISSILDFPLETIFNYVFLIIKIVSGREMKDRVLSGISEQSLSRGNTERTVIQAI